MTMDRPARTPLSRSMVPETVTLEAPVLASLLAVRVASSTTRVAPLATWNVPFALNPMMSSSW